MNANGQYLGRQNGRSYANVWQFLGRFYGFLGPNGAGKSTTIKMLTGLLAPTFGSIQILGHKLTGDSADLEVKRRVGVVPEDLALYDHLASREYLSFIGRIYGIEKDEVRARIDSLLALMKLEEHESKLSMEFSHGMKKKLARAAALIGNPELLFLDEPFEGVDAVSTSILRETLQQFVRRGGSIFLTSHVLDIVQRLCTDVAIIDKGTIMHETSMDKLDGLLEDWFLGVAGKEKGGRDLNWLEGGASSQASQPMSACRLKAIFLLR